MNFEYSEKSIAFQEKLRQFIARNILPVQEEVASFHRDPDNIWKRWPGIDAMKEKAKDEGLWNLFLPKTYPPDTHSCGRAFG